MVNALILLILFPIFYTVCYIVPNKENLNNSFPFHFYNDENSIRTYDYIYNYIIESNFLYTFQELTLNVTPVIPFIIEPILIYMMQDSFENQLIDFRDVIALLQSMSTPELYTWINAHPNWFEDNLNRVNEILGALAGNNHPNLYNDYLEIQSQIIKLQEKYNDYKSGKWWRMYGIIITTGLLSAALIFGSWWLSNTNAWTTPISNSTQSETHIDIEKTPISTTNATSAQDIATQTDTPTPEQNSSISPNTPNNNFSNTLYSALKGIYDKLYITTADLWKFSLFIGGTIYTIYNWLLPIARGVWNFNIAVWNWLWRNGLALFNFLKKWLRRR